MTLTDPKAVANAIAAQAAAANAPRFLMVYAGIVDGKSWCGDCRAAEPLVNKKFAEGPSQRLSIHYAGDKET